MDLGRQATNAMHRAVLGERSLDLHPGLLLCHGLDQWPDKDSASKDGETPKTRLIQRLAQCKASGYYRAALARWQRCTKDASRFTSFQSELEGRLYIGVTRDNPLEAGVTTSHSYGMPLIPGSSVKGLARSAALDLVDHGSLDRDSVDWMFGRGGDEGEVGGVIFHDAWWCGEALPFVAEVVTPHHVGYYAKGGKEPPRDSDSPVPAPQIAVAGSFHFTIEGDPAWTAVAAVILRGALETRGIGAKRSSGYGVMRVDRGA